MIMARFDHSIFPLGNIRLVIPSCSSESWRQLWFFSSTEILMCESWFSKICIMSHSMIILKNKHWSCREYVSVWGWGRESIYVSVLSCCFKLLLEENSKLKTQSASWELQLFPSQFFPLWEGDHDKAMRHETLIFLQPLPRMVRWILLAIVLFLLLIIWCSGVLWNSFEGSSDYVKLSIM